MGWVSPFEHFSFVLSKQYYIFLRFLFVRLISIIYFSTTNIEEIFSKQWFNISGLVIQLDIIIVVTRNLKNLR